MSFVEAVEAISSTVAPRGAAAAPGQGAFQLALDQTAGQPTVAPPAVEMRITPPPSSDGFGGKIMDHLGAFYDQAQAWQTSGFAGRAESSPATDVTGSIPQPSASATAVPEKTGAAPAVFDAKHAAAMLEQAFAFAIETTLVSKASTESTRIFNTFLKGQ
ncbi:hypothetical protein [Bradyrhizobium sp. USDA 4353]